MRLASVLLVLTLLTTCMTAGTFAKYVTSAEGSGTARVAKFGVDVSVNAGDVFGQNYANKDAGNGVVADKNGATVSAKDMVVAPGTQGSMTFSITGTPETAVTLNISLDDKESPMMKEVMLKAGTYKDMTTDTEVELDADYYPVKWTLKDSNQKVVGQLENKKLSEIEDYFSKLEKDYNPNKNLTEVLGGDGTYTLSWNWAIEENNAADTLLGNIQADSKLVQKRNPDEMNFGNITTADYNLTEAFNFTISVTQVD